MIQEQLVVPTSQIYPKHLILMFRTAGLLAKSSPLETHLNHFSYWETASERLEASYTSQLLASFLFPLPCSCLVLLPIRWIPLACMFISISCRCGSLIVFLYSVSGNMDKLASDLLMKVFPIADLMFGNLRDRLIGRPVYFVLI